MARLSIIAGLILATAACSKKPAPAPDAGVVAMAPSDAGVVEAAVDAGTPIPPVPSAAPLKPGESRVLTGPSARVTGVAWSPDGARLASTGADRLVRIFDGETGLMQLALDGPTAPSRTVAWSPDGQIIVASDEAGALLGWKADGTPAWTARLPPKVVATSIAFEPSGATFIAGGTDGIVRYVDARSGKFGRSMKAGPSAVTSVVWSRDGKFIASAAPIVRIWDGPNGQMLRVAQEPPKKPTIYSLAFAPDSRVLAGGTTAGQVDFWTVLDGKGLAEIDAHTERVTALSYSKSGEALVTASDDHRLRLWNMNTGQVGTEFASHTDVVGTVQITLDGKRVASGSADGSVRIWNASTGELRQRLAGPKGAVVALQQLPGQRTVMTLTVDGDIAAWDLSNGSARWQRHAHDGAGRAMVVVPDGRYVLTTGGLQAVPGQPGEAPAAGTRGSIKVWDPTRAVAVRELGAPSGLLSALALSGDGRTMVSGADLGKTGDILIWDVSASATKARVGGALPPIRALAYAASVSLFASAGADGSISLIDPRTTVTQQTLKVGAPAQAVALSADGSLVAVGYEGKDGASVVQLWDTQSGKLVRSLTGQRGRVSGLVFSPDGWFLLSMTAGAAGDARLWVVETGDTQSVAPATGFAGYTAGDFAPDAHNIALAAADGSLRLWQAK